MIFSIVALIVLYLGGTPLAKNGTSPHRIIKPSRWPSVRRTTGTCWVGATL
jgi:hypothetical protein